jgi:hypothetical protein
MGVRSTIILMAKVLTLSRNWKRDGGIENFESCSLPVSCPCFGLMNCERPALPQCLPFPESIRIPSCCVSTLVRGFWKWEDAEKVGLIKPL